MKPLLKPAHPPDPGVLNDCLAMSGLANFSDVDSARDAEERVLEIIRSMVRFTSREIEQEERDSASFLRSYYLSTQKGYVGSAFFACNVGEEKAHEVSMSIQCHYPWSALPKDMENIVSFFDRLWESLPWTSLYGYDMDDDIIQNFNSTIGMEFYGIERDQVTITRKWVVEEIDTRGNPGYVLSKGGIIWSVCWLNYWSNEAIAVMFGNRPSIPSSVAETKDFGNKGIRVRLSERPGRYDDVQFHERQLEFRRKFCRKWAAIGAFCFGDERGDRASPPQQA